MPDLKTITALFQLSGDYHSGGPYGSGHINDTYAVTLNQAGVKTRYILQRINNTIFKDIPALMDNIRRVTGFQKSSLEGEDDISRRALTVVPSKEGLPYAVSKRRAEDVVLDPRLRDRLEGVVVRPGLVPYGPRDRLFSWQLCQVLRGRLLPLIHGGRTRICTSYVENLAAGVALTVERPEAAYETLNLTDDGAPTWAALFGAFARALGTAPRMPGLPWASYSDVIT